MKTIFSVALVLGVGMSCVEGLDMESPQQESLINYEGKHNESK